MKPNIIKKLFLLFVFLVVVNFINSGFTFAASETSKTRNEVNRDKILELNNNPDQQFKFVVVGDSRTYPKRFARIVNLINSLDPDFVVHLGDIVTTGKKSEYDEVMPIFDKINCPVVAVAGNHELEKTKTPKTNFLKYFGDCEFTFDIHNVRFILVDNSNAVLRKKQLERIRNDLDTDLIRMVFMHAPPDGPYPKHNFKAGAKALVDMVIETGCEYCFFGHIHGYDYRMIGEKCNAYISGGGGAELSSYGIAEKIHHVLLVSVNGENVNVEMIPLED